MVVSVGEGLVALAIVPSVAAVLVGRWFTNILRELNVTVSTNSPAPPAVTPEELKRIAEEFEESVSQAAPAPRGQLTYRGAADQFFGEGEPEG